MQPDLGNILVYIAGPLTGKTEQETFDNIEVAEGLAYLAMLRSFAVLCPHSLGRSFVNADELTPAFWYRTTLTMLLRCDAVLMAPLWKNSKGASNERRVALENDIPVFENLEDLVDAFTD